MFYTYNQNNSGGTFVHSKSKNIAHYVIVEAESKEDADNRAEDIGLYFDGCANGQDCSCCGDRWSRAWEEGTETPEVFGKHPNDHEDSWFKKGDSVAVHYKDGQIEWY